MKLITQLELASKNNDELRGLYRKTFNARVQSVPESARRRKALGSLENLTRLINQTYSNQWERDTNLLGG